MESEQDKITLREEVLLHGPGRVKQGLVWLQSDKAKELGLSLEQLVTGVVHDQIRSEYFDLTAADTCALGYAGTFTSYAQVKEQMGSEWLVEHGFVLNSGEESWAPIIRAYEALTEEWRTQLEALANEVDCA